MNNIERLHNHFNTSLKRSFRGIEDSAWQADIGINVAFGIDHLGLPARFLAGFVPAFSLSEALEKDKDTQPELRVFVPLHISEFCNSLSVTQGERTIHQGVLFVQKFQEIFHPSVTWFLDIDQPITQEAIELLTSLSQNIVESNDPKLQQQWQSIHAAASRRGATDVAKLYASHHVFGWQDCMDPKFFTTVPKRITVNCFSRREEPFQLIRQTIVRSIEKNDPKLLVRGEHIDLFTNRCPGPHYIPSGTQSAHEPLLEDLLLLGFEKTRGELIGLLTENPKFGTAIRDLDSINEHIEEKRKENLSLPNIDDFLKEVDCASK